MMTWEASDMGKRALASGYTFAHAPPDPNRKWGNYESSQIRNIGEGCITNILNPLNETTNPDTHHFTQVRKERGPTVVRCLCDTGADLSFITKALAEEVERRNRGVKGEGKYKVMDAFKRIHFFTENITIEFRFESLINLKDQGSLFSCKFVIVDIPFNSDVILGLKDIRRLRVFSLIPHLITETEDQEQVKEDTVVDWDEEEDESDRGDWRKVKLSNIYGSEWIDEEHINSERTTEKEGECEGEAFYLSMLSAIDGITEKMEGISLAKRAYEREDLSEMDDDRFEAFPTDALGEDIFIIPNKIFGPERLKKGLRDLVERYGDVFSKTVRSSPAKVSPMKIEVDPKLWCLPKNRLPPRNLGRVREDEINRQCDILEERGVIEPSSAGHHSHPFTVPKPDGTWRFVMDLVNLNRATLGAERWPIPNIGELLRRIGRKKPKYFCVMDLTSGFHQAPIAPECRHLTAFITRRGLYQWCRVVMGAMAAPPYFQRVISTEVLAGYVQTICELYIDDVITYGSTIEETLENLEKILARFRTFGITVNPEKCKLGLTEIEYVGHTINSDGLHFTREKLDSVLNFPLPITQADLKSFVGLANYFRDHVGNASILMQPLHDLMKPFQPKKGLIWSEEGKEAFEIVK